MGFFLMRFSQINQEAVEIFSFARPELPYVLYEAITQPVVYRSLNNATNRTK